MSLSVAGAAAVVAVAAGWLHRPSAPDLDGERWFKTALSTVLLGQIDSNGGSADDWIEAVRASVPWNPAARDLQAKLERPAGWRPPGGLWLEGESELVEELAALPSAQLRWRRMFEEDEVVLTSLIDDPTRLGPAYDPATTVGVGWDEIAAGVSLAQPLQRSLAALWVVVSPHTEESAALREALFAELGDDVVSVEVTDEEPDGAAVALRSATLAALEGQPEGRPVVLVGIGDGAHLAVRALAGAPGFRDRVVSLAALSPRFFGHGSEGPWSQATLREWWGVHWRHSHLDTERIGQMPLMLLRFVDPENSSSVSALADGWPGELDADDDAAPYGVKFVDLGVLPRRDDVPLDAVMSALRLVITAWYAAST